MPIDTFEFDYGKWLIRLSTEYDEGVGSPFKEYGTDAYSQAQEDAWSRDEWQWVVLKAEAIREGITLGTAYLGAVESGFIPDDEGNERKFTQARKMASGWVLYTTGFYDPTQDLVSYHDTVEEAVSEAEATLGKLKEG